MADPATIENDLRYLAKSLHECSQTDNYQSLRNTVDLVLGYGQMILTELKNEHTPPMRNARSVVETVVVELQEGLMRSGTVGSVLASLPADEGTSSLKNQVLPRVEGILREYVNAAAQNISRLLKAAERLRDRHEVELPEIPSETFARIWNLLSVIDTPISQLDLKMTVACGTDVVTGAVKFFESQQPPMIFRVRNGKKEAGVRAVPPYKGMTYKLKP